MPQTPSIGRIVHTRHDNQVCAAIITYVGGDGTVNLAVFDLYGQTLPKQCVAVVDDVSQPGTEGCAFPAYVAPTPATQPATTLPPIPAPPVTPAPSQS